MDLRHVVLVTGVGWNVAVPLVDQPACEELMIVLMKAKKKSLKSPLGILDGDRRIAGWIVPHEITSCIYRPYFDGDTSEKQKHQAKMAEMIDAQIEFFKKQTKE